MEQTAERMSGNLYHRLHRLTSLVDDVVADARGVRHARRCRTRVGGWRKTPEGGLETGGGAHHKGACLPTSVVENRAPLLILMAPALRRRTLPNNAEEPRLLASVVPSRRGQRYFLSDNTSCEVFKQPKAVV
jgi:hypothetical protein